MLMTFSSFLVKVVLGWTCLYICAKLWRHPKIWTRRQAPELLPSSSGKSRRPLPSVHGKFLGSINVNIQFGWLWIEVKSFNESLINILQKTSPAKKTARSGSHRLITGSLSIFYDVGAVVGLAGFLLLPLFLVFLLFSALSAIPVSQTMARTTITGDIQQSTQTAAQAAPFFLLPGITTPLRDLPVTLAAGLFAITWHEFGHAFSAALYVRRCLPRDSQVPFSDPPKLWRALTGYRHYRHSVVSGRLCDTSQNDLGASAIPREDKHCSGRCMAQPRAVALDLVVDSSWNRQHEYQNIRSAWM